MQTTINQLRVELQLLQQAYEPLNSFFWGSFQRSQDEVNNGLTYPLMCCYYTNGGDMTKNTVPINLVIVIADRVYDDFSNLSDTESDTLQVCKDIVNIMTTSKRWNRICRVTSAVPEKFIEEKEDKVTGHYIRMTVTLFDNKNICDVPVFGYDFEGGFTPVCEPAFIFGSDNVYQQYVDAGAQFQLPDTTIVFTINGEQQAPVSVATLGNEIINLNISYGS